MTDKVRINDSELLVKRNSHEIKLIVWVSFSILGHFWRKSYLGRTSISAVFTKMTVCEAELLKKLIKASA